MVAFSQELQDAFNPLASVVASHLSFIGDVRSFYAERVNLEREYAKGLAALVAKSGQKTNAMAEQLVAGDAPSKMVGEGAGRDHTLYTAWNSILSQADEEAYSRSNFAESLQADVVEGLKNLSKRMDGLRVKHIEFASDTLKERDNAYASKTKAKHKYDACCATVESNRQKLDGSKNDRKAEKATMQQQQYMTEMYTAKNIYILSVQVSNRMKDKYFQRDLPSMHDDMQDLWSTIVIRFRNIVAKGGQDTKRQYEVLQRYNQSDIGAIACIDPGKDQALYADYNKRPFFPPAEFTFEPCGIWHDNGDINLDPEPKVFLQNLLARNQIAMIEIAPRVDALRREARKLAELREAYTNNPALGDLDTVTENYFESIREAVSLETERDALEAEISLLKSTLGGDVGSGRTHTFHPSAFPVSKQCYVCQGKIWGLNKAGLHCQECGTNLHSHCELKCPADCGDPSLALTRAASHVSYSSGHSSQTLTVHPDGSSRRSSIISKRSSSSINVSSAPKKTAKAIFDYAAQSEQQISVIVNETLEVVTADSGNGWTKVLNSQGISGIVPTSYIKLEAPPPPLTQRPRSSASTGSSGAYGLVTTMYVYAARSPQELSVDEGEVLELTSKGHSIAPGWTEVTQNGKKGIVPTSYVK